MAITSAIVLYVVIWTLTFFVAIPIRLKTQGDAGDIVPGTHASAPEVHNLKKKAWITTGVAFVLWAIVTTIILSGWISVSDFDVMHVLGRNRG
jgi:predicted secreted protein